MMVYWLVIVVGFPMFLLVTDKVIGYVTLSDWEIQHLAPGIPWWQASLRDLAILSLINIPSTVLVAIASWKITKENVERSFWHVFATATLTVIPPLSGIIMVVAFLYFVAAVLWIWTILMVPAYGWKRVAAEIGVGVGTIYRVALEGSKIRERVF
jgi:hypothetical protein